MTGSGCGEHRGMADELRALAVAAMDRIEPALARLREEPRNDGTTGGWAACTACPICALIAVLRGEHSELTARLAEQAAGLFAVLRAALEEGNPAPRPGPPPPAPDRPAPARRAVQHIDVVRRGVIR